MKREVKRESMRKREREKEIGTKNRTGQNDSNTETQR